MFSRSTKIRTRFFTALVLILTVFFCVRAPASHAVDAPRNFSSDRELADLIWELSGWFTQDVEKGSPGGLTERSLSVGNPGSGEETLVTLSFQDMDPWPLALSMVRTVREGDKVSSSETRDRRPFGTVKEGSSDGVDTLGQMILSALRALRTSPMSTVPEFVPSGPGLSRAFSKARYGVRMGNTSISFIKADPRLWGISPYGETENVAWKETPTSIRGWLSRIDGAGVVVNGGQYFRDRSSMGYLVRDDVEIEPRHHKLWKGYLGSFPKKKSIPYFSIIDKELPRASESEENYRSVVQSFMVLDRRGEIRVKNTDHMASRSVIGEDGDGNMVIMVATGALTLYDTALILKELGIFPAISLDGGSETQLAVNNDGKWSFLYGGYSHNAFGNIRLKDYHPSLPYVMALRPMSEPPED